jgi:molybdopterin/thiamine biosynthesis adenylyltransferase
MKMENRFARQILAFGAEGQSAIERQKLGIVGLGGIGSQTNQTLAYLGGHDFVLVDDDRIDDTNLNRLIGATPADVDAKRLKTEIAERTIRAINPSATVNSIPRNLRSQQALDALVGCTTIFGCVDNDGARLILMELACAYSITLIDAASEIILNSPRTHIEDFGGRVVVCRPGDFCLVCANEIDLEVAKSELESEEVQQLRKSHGYGLGEHFPAPAVVSLNGIIANIAVTEFLAMITGIRQPSRKRLYRGMRGIILENRDARRNDCYNCAYLVGQKSAANIHRYIPAALSNS